MFQNFFILRNLESIETIQTGWFHFLSPVNELLQPELVP